MQNLSKNELKLIEASKGKTIHMASNAEFGTLLLRCSAIVGGSKQIGTEASLLIKKVVVDLFPWCAMDELERACVLNVGRELFAESEKVAKSENQPVDHITIFGELTCDSICAMLKRYQVIRNAAKIKFQALENAGRPQLTQGEPPIVSDQDWQQVFEKDCKHYSEGKDFWSIIAVRMVQWLIDTGKITDETFSNEQIRTFKDRARKKILFNKNLTMTRFNNMEDYQKKAIDNESIVELKTFIYEAYIKQTLSNGTGNKA